MKRWTCSRASERILLHMKRTTKYQVMWVWSLRRWGKHNCEIPHIDRITSNPAIYKQTQNLLLHKCVFGVQNNRSNLGQIVQADGCGRTSWTNRCGWNCMKRLWNSSKHADRSGCADWIGRDSHDAWIRRDDRTDHAQCGRMHLNGEPMQLK